MSTLTMEYLQINKVKHTVDTQKFLILLLINKVKHTVDTQKFLILLFKAFLPKS